jgi:hypothetical protein
MTWAAAADAIYGRVVQMNVLETWLIRGDVAAVQRMLKGTFFLKSVGTVKAPGFRRVRKTAVKSSH